MANEKHLKQLKRGVRAWNGWREEEDVAPDLRGADLGGADLGGVNLVGAYLRGAYLRGAYLRDADLRGANLRDANLRDANLRDADLRDADLRGADVGDADLRGADVGDVAYRQSGGKAMKYTVVGFFEDNNQTFVEYVEADDAEDAAHGAQRGLGATIGVVEVFAGHLECAWGNSQVEYLEHTEKAEGKP